MPSADERREELKAVYRQASVCERCPQLASSRQTVVFGSGNANADLMFIGEAPGAEEDRQGLPFVGRAGGLLNELLGEIGLDRGDVFVANVLKCRPPGNRDPQPDEIETCRPYLHSQVALIEPRVICTLGNFSTKLLTGSPQGITRVHGQPQRHNIGASSVVIYPLFHPAAALRTPSVKQQLADDFARLPRLLADSAPAEPGPAQAREIEQMGLFG
jgi:DNA polymerase